MNGASYIVVSPTALVPVEQTNALVLVECPDGILPIQTVLQEPSINELASSKCSSEDVLAVEAPTEKVPLKKAIGHGKGSLGYSAEEHVALLSCISATPNSFNASESSPEWRAVQQKMLDVYQMGVAPQQSTTLLRHFVDLYNALKQVIHALSLQSSAPKCPTNAADVDDEESMSYVKASNRKFLPKKWWIVDFTQQLLKLHLDYNKAFGGNTKQDTTWLNLQKWL